MQIEVEVAEKLQPLFVSDKRMKVAVGGRAGTKSFAFADAMLKFVDAGAKVLCAREFQNSIEESVHSLLQRRIDALEVGNLFEPTAKTIASTRNQGQVLYRGLARNIQSIKSLDGINIVWCEEGQTLSDQSINILFPTIREAGSEIWISANRGSSNDAFSRFILAKAEKDLERCGIYEDENMIVVEINWWDNPWWNKTLEQQRLMDKDRLSDAEYLHIWEGKYSDTVENAIIKPDWFDACIDAHKRLGFEPSGIEVVAHDPSDSGDARARCHRHGVVIKSAETNEHGDVNEGCDWATALAAQLRVEAFVWDESGLGLPLKRQISENIGAKDIELHPFNGGGSVDRPDEVYSQPDGDSKGIRAVTNRDRFANKRAQYYGELADRCYNTWLAVVKGRYVSPDDMISFDSEGITEMGLLRSELCRVPKVDNGAGKLQIMSKPQMKTKGIPSPNLADCVMMSFAVKEVASKRQDNWTPPKINARARKASNYAR